MVREEHVQQLNYLGTSGYAMVSFTVSYEIRTTGKQDILLFFELSPQRWVLYRVGECEVNP